MRVIIEDDHPHGPEPMPPMPMPIIVHKETSPAEEATPVDNGKMEHMMKTLEQIRQRHNDDVFFAGELQSNIGGDKGELEEKKPKHTAF